MKAFKAILVLCLAVLIAGCGSIDVQRYRERTPALDLRRYFNGTVEGWGMFQKSSGELVKHFHVRIESRWQGDTGSLDEHFTWSDGSTSRRVWTLTDLGNGRYQGRADDVVGIAEGETAGNALRWRYVLALPVDGTTWHVDFDDWMFLVTRDVLLNRARMSKLGVPLGEVTLSFRLIRRLED